MPPFFFYGTLLDPDVRRVVLLGETGRIRLSPALLQGYRRVRARDGHYPVLERALAGQVSGALVEGLERRHLHCLAHYEGPSYLPWPVVLRTAEGRVPALTLLPHQRHAGSGEPWALHRWQRRHKARAMHRIVSWFAEPTVATPHSIDISWRMRRWIDAVAPAPDKS